jgi:hypothetical protein
MTGARPALVVAVHDGFYGFGTGAGRSNRAFLQVLCELLDPSVRLTVLPVRLASDSAEYAAASLRVVSGMTLRFPPRRAARDIPGG